MVSRILNRILLAAGVIGACSIAPVTAQTDYSARKATSMLSVGLGFAGGISMTIDAPENWKLAPGNFAYRTGVDVSYPLTPSIGATLGLGLDSRATKVYWYSDKTLWESRRVDYFSITPGFRFSSFFLGLNLGIPMGGARFWQNAADVGEQSIDLDSDIDKLLVMIEPRVGVVVPILDEEIGWLGLGFTAGYNLNNMSDRADFMPGPARKTPLGTQTLSAHLGLTWQFGIPGTGKGK